MRFTIKAKLAVTFGVLIALLAGAGALSYTRMDALNDTISEVIDKSAKRVELMGTMKAAMVASIKSEKDAILASTDADLKEATDMAASDNAQFQKAFDALYAFASEDGKRRLDKIKA